MRNTVTSGLSDDLLISFNRPYCRKSFEKARDRLAMVSHRRVHVLNHGHSEVTTTLLRESSVLGSRTMTVSELSPHSDPGYTPGKFAWLHLAPLWRHSADRLPPQTDTSAPNHSCGRSSWKRCLQDHTKHYLPTLLLLVNIKVVFFFLFFFWATQVVKVTFPYKLHIQQTSSSIATHSKSCLWPPKECKSNNIPHQLLRKWSDPFRF